MAIKNDVVGQKKNTGLQKEKHTNFCTYYRVAKDMYGMTMLPKYTLKISPPKRHRYLVQ